jgi:hypothetical protein
MTRTFLRVVVFTAFISVSLWTVGSYEGRAQGQGAPAGPAPAGRGGRGGGAPAAPQTAQASATSDFTGYWVRLVTEDWRWLMIVPPKGNADSVQLTPAGRAVLDAWDPAKDEAEGNQCKGYGAGAISRIPTRAHITWQDPDTLKWETDQGMQTRLFKFGSAAQQSETNPGPRTWQGISSATWEPVAGGGRGGGAFGGPAGPGGPGGPGFPGAPPALADDQNPAPPAVPLPLAGGRGGNANQNGWLKVVTTNAKSGYLRKNGVPYSEKATITEYFQPTPETYGVRYMIVTTIIDDPEYLGGSWVTSSNYKKLPETNNGWDPQPCSVR